MDNLILKRCKYCDKTYEGTSEIFPFGEDKGLQKRGVKKTKILFRTIGIAILIYILTYYFLEQL